MKDLVSLLRAALEAENVRTKNEREAQGDLFNGCRVCGRVKVRAWGLCSTHYRSRRRVVLKAAIIRDVGGKCADCGGEYSLPVFDFHHSREKNHAISYILKNATLDVVAREMQHCVLLCANCHRKRHHDSDV